MKKILFALILILPLIFAGVSSTSMAEESKTGFIEVQTLSYSSGAVLQGFYFSINEDLLESLGASTEDITIFKSRLKSNITKFKNLMVANFANIYLQNPNEEFAIGENGGLVIKEVISSQNDYLGFQLLFTSSKAWSFYHPNSSTSEDASSQDQDKIEFVTTNNSSGQIIFAQSLSNYNQTIGQYLIDIYLSAGEGIIVNLEENYCPSLIYDYGVSSSKLHSNADQIFLGNDNLYHHVWQRSLENYTLQDSINLYYHQVNQQWWYLTIICIGVGIVLVGTSIVLIYNRYKQKPKKNKE